MDQARVFKTELLRDSRITAVSLSETVPGGWSRGMYGFRPEGVEEQIKVRVYEVDGDFVEIMGLRMSEGRDLNDEATGEIVINEAAARMLGRTEPLDEMINFKGQRRIVGVIEDFHFDGPHTKIGPLFMVPFSPWHWAGVIIVRVQPGHLDAALKVIDDKWAAARPIAPSCAILSKKSSPDSTPRSC